MIFSPPGTTIGIFPDPIKPPTPISAKRETPIKNMEIETMKKIRDKKSSIFFLNHILDINNIIPIIIIMGILPTYN